MFRATCTSLAFASTQVRRIDIFGRQCEFNTPLSVKDKQVQTYADEYFRPPVNKDSVSKFGPMGKYVDPEFCKVDTTSEVKLNTYPDGTPYTLVQHVHQDIKDADDLDKHNAGFFSEDFFRKNILREHPKEQEEDKARVIDYCINSVGFALTLIAVRTFMAAFWYSGTSQLKYVYLANLEMEVPELAPRQCLTVTWRGKPVYIYKRSEAQMKSILETPMSALKDPEEDEARYPDPEHRDTAIMLAICTHLGCVPLPNDGIYHGFFCPCHGSHYDPSGRIRMGPAPLNLPVPGNKWLDANTIYIGKL